MEHPSFDPEIEKIVETILKVPTDIIELTEHVEKAYQTKNTTDVYSFLAQDIQDHLYSVYSKISTLVNAEILPLGEIIAKMQSPDAKIGQDELDDGLSALLTSAAKKWYETASESEKAVIFGQSYDEIDGVTYLTSLLFEYINPISDMH